MGSSGLYGTVRGAVLDIDNDVDMWMVYRADRASESTVTKIAKPSTWLSQEMDGDDEIKGLFNLSIPVAQAQNKGFYTIYIAPKKISTSIVDVSVLSSYTGVRGVVLRLSALGMDSVDSLVGCRIEYENGTTRLITSANYCEPVMVSVLDNYPSMTRYNLKTNNNSGLVFCTVTPSASGSASPTATPYIGVASENISIYNTKFDPLSVEIEMTDNDLDTIATMIGGDQIRSLDNGLITTYTTDHEISRQYEYFVLKSTDGTPLYEVKRRRSDIDSSQDYDNIISGAEE